MKRFLPPLLLLPLLFAACSSEEQSKYKLTIKTPSSKKVVVDCPQGSDKPVCREAVRFAEERGGSVPSFRMGCPSSRYYSVRGRVATSSGARNIYAAWDCNTMVPLWDLYRSVREEAKSVLGPATGLSDYDETGRQSVNEEPFQTKKS